MIFYNKIEEILKKQQKALMFVDMDGVIVEYDYAPDLIKNNVPGKFLNQRPLKTTINVLRQIAEIENIELYILSSCNFNDQASEKNIWLDNNAPFFKKENRIFVIKENEDYINNDKNDMKTIYIEKIMEKEKCHFSIMMDDTHELLKRAKNKLKEKIEVFHVSALID